MALVVNSGPVEKVRQRRLGPMSSFARTDLALFVPFALTYSVVYAPGAKAPAALPVEKGVLAPLGG